MPVSLIPFDMPAAAEIPPHITDQLRRMEPLEAVRQGMDLLMQIEAADTLVYEEVDGGGALVLAAVAGSEEGRAASLQAELEEADCYGRPWADAAPSLGSRALREGRALLVMGQAGGQEEADGSDGLPPALLRYMLGGGAAGNIGFNYVLPLADGNGPLGALTLLRGAGSGPLNHEQPNLTEALRQILVETLAADRAS